MNESLSVWKPKGATTISVNSDKNKHRQRVTIISENPSFFTGAKASNEDKNCDSFSSNDESEANDRSDYL